MKSMFATVTLIGFLLQDAFAVISINPTNSDSIKQAAATAAAGMVQYYTGDRPGDTPGNLPDPYYWWEAGAMFGALIDYWYFTGDDQYNGIITQAMLHQAGPDRSFMPLNQTKTLGNDDQAFWGMSAMLAAENKFPNPPDDQPQWLALAQAVYNTQVPRWNTDSCGGGLKWQVFPFNNGYNYKNTISNGCFFNLASRLATYTGNATYAEWATRTWDWSSFEGGGVSLFDEEYNFYDGKDDLINCTEWDRNQWSYNAGVFLAGAANMYNFTEGSPVWENRIRGIIGRIDIFFKEGVMWEAICEVNSKCNIDQRSFKAYFARWMAATIHRAPFTRELLKPLLESSAIGAAAACNGGNDGNQCNTYWTPEEQQKFPFQTGVGEQMSALEVFQSNMVDWVAGPATAQTGISPGDVNAGNKAPVRPEDFLRDPVTTGDRVGAGILTVVIVTLVVSTAVWLISSD